MKKTLVAAVVLVVVIALLALVIGWLQKKGGEKEPVQSKKEAPQQPQKKVSDSALSFDGRNQAPDVSEEQCGRVRLVIKL